MGINKEQFGISIEKQKGYINTATNKISIAQKTVNTRGIKELIDSEVLFNANNATTNGSAVTTLINQTINLNDDINKFTSINFQLGVKSVSLSIKSKVNEFGVSQIIYNNTETINYTDGSVLFIVFDARSNGVNAYGSSSFILEGWFKTNTQFFLSSFTNPLTDTNYNRFSIFSIKGINIENVTIDPVEYVNTNSGIEDAPVGYIMSFMGTTVPNHYLACDGSIYNITTYPNLSQFIKDQFGAFNHFGGDGVTTFAVPDLRNEFLRGFHGTKVEQLSGEVGVHQDATSILNSATYRASTVGQYLPYYGTNTGATTALNGDKTTSTATGRLVINGTLDSTVVGHAATIATRPTNTAVLYCIKYEPTYFMSIQGLVEETPLWEGNVGTSTTTALSSTLSLSDSFMNYDMIEIWFTASIGDGARRPQCRFIKPIQIKNVIDSGNVQMSINMSWGYSSTADYTDIRNTSTATVFQIQQVQSYINKIIGIKYKTFQK